MSRPRGWRRRAGTAGLTLLAALMVGCADPDQDAGPASPAYPEARREARVSVFHGTPVSDPYRWLEDPDGAETRAWLRAQQHYARAAFPVADADGRYRSLFDALRGLARAGVPQLANGRYAYLRTEGSNGNPEIWLTLDPADPGRPIVSADDLPQPAVLGAFSLSPDGALLAFGFRSAGEPVWRWRIRDIQTGDDAAAELTLAVGSGVAWSPDSRGLYYTREPVATGDGRALSLGIWYHRAGTASARDVQVYTGRMPSGAQASPRVTDDGRYLLVEFTAGHANAIHYQKLGRIPARARVIRLLDGWDARFRFIGGTERTFYLLTTAGAARGQIVAIDLDRPDPASWRSVVPEGDMPLEEALVAGGRLALVYRDKARSRLAIHDLAGQLVREVELPDVGFAGVLSGSHGETELLYGWSDRSRPATTWRHDVNSGDGGPLLPAELPPGIATLGTRQLDGRYGVSASTSTLMLGDPPDLAPRALLVTVEPGVSSALTQWQPGAVAWAATGGSWLAFVPGDDPVLASAELLTALERLVADGEAQAGRIAIAASGRGSMIAAALINQRPELFVAAVLGEAPLDLLRAEPAGGGYGHPAQPDDFIRILALSPYHQVQAGRCYPPLVVRPGADGAPTPAWQAWKYLAALQAAQACDHPLLLGGPEAYESWLFLAAEASIG